MGSIIHINKKPNRWKMIDEGKKLKCNSESVVKVTYGDFDDDPDGYTTLEMYMRKSIFDNLLNGKYYVSKDFCRDLRILDENNNIIEPLADGVIY